MRLSDMAHDNCGPGSVTHFMGIGGIGMSGLAAILKERGGAVSGCDVSAKQPSSLVGLGVPIACGHHPLHLTAEVGTVVFSSAVSSTEPELAEAKARGLRTIGRGELLAEIASTTNLVAVAGAHGKTTTSGMAAQLLIQAGWDPTAVVGGHVVSLGTNARHGRGQYLVAETDESDGSFLRLHPSVAIITNVDREHLNYYKTFENLVAAFRQFVRQLGPRGVLIRCNDDPVARTILEHPRQLTYGIDQPADVTADHLTLLGGRSEFTACYQGQRLGTFRLRVPGRHNILNALGVISLGIVLDLPLAVIREALWAFQGTLRRYQVVRLPRDIAFVEDYAHHPSEIRTTLAADPSISRHRLVVFQPHRFSRTKSLEQEFTSCFDQADGVIITDIDAAFEPPIAGVSGERLAGLVKAHGHPCVRYVPRTELTGYLTSFIQAKDTVFFLGAGDIGQLCHDVATRLRAPLGTAR